MRSHIAWLTLYLAYLRPRLSREQPVAFPQTSRALTFSIYFTITFTHIINLVVSQTKTNTHSYL